MIIPILIKGDVSSYHRLYVPFFYDKELWNPEFETENLDSLLSKAKVVIFNRTCGMDIIHLLRLKKRYKFKIVTDLDDYWQLYPNHVSYDSWQKNNMQQKILESLMNSDYVFVTNPRLAEMVKVHNRNVEVIPNCLPFGEGQFNDYRESISNKVRFVYAGGSTHLFDLKTAENAFKLLALDEGFTASVKLCGYEDRPAWNKMEKILSANGNLSGYERAGRLPLDEYMNHYNTSDVSIAPLEKNYFNRFKSILKIVEAGCKNIPIITSDVPPYSDEDTKLLIKCRNTRHWYDAMVYCANNPGFVQQRGAALGEYVRQKYDLKKANKTRKQIFDYLINKG